MTQDKIKEIKEYCERAIKFSDDVYPTQSEDFKHYLIGKKMLAETVLMIIKNK